MSSNEAAQRYFCCGIISFVNNNIPVRVNSDVFNLCDHLQYWAVLSEVGRRSYIIFPFLVKISLFMPLVASSPAIISIQFVQIPVLLIVKKAVICIHYTSRRFPVRTSFGGFIIRTSLVTTSFLWNLEDLYRRTVLSQQTWRTSGQLRLSYIFEDLSGINTWHMIIEKYLCWSTCFFRDRQCCSVNLV